MSQPTEIKVRGYHLDLYGHVNNARYLEFLEEARWRHFEAGGGLERLFERDLGFAIVNININYSRAALNGELLSIGCEITKFGRRSVVMHQTVVLNPSGEAIADADVTFVVVDLNTEKAVAIEGELREFLEGVKAS